MTGMAAPSTPRVTAARILLRVKTRNTRTAIRLVLSERRIPRITLLLHI